MPFFSNLLRGAGVARETAVTDGWMNLELQAKIAAHALLRGLVDASLFQSAAGHPEGPVAYLLELGALDDEDVAVLERLCAEAGAPSPSPVPPSEPGDAPTGLHVVQGVWDSLPRIGESRDGTGRQVLQALTLPAWRQYRNLRFVAEGGMGRVFRAWDPSLKRAVALKFLRRDDPDLLKRFVLEAQHQARVEHPHIGQVYEVGEWEGQAYIAMQFVKGGTLEQMAPKLSLEDKAQVMERVAEAIHAAHREGLIHRDLKPANILVEAGDSGPRPVVVDFGLAKGLESTGLTQQGLVIGTVHYMAPEQARGEHDQVGRRTDVYGLGATFHKMLTGLPPFAQAEGMDAIRAALDDDVPSLLRLVPDLPEDLDLIVRTCLEKDPARRYESALAVAEDLRRWREGEPIRAQRPTVRYRAGKWARKHRLVVLVAGVALAAMLGLAGYAGWLSWSAGARARHAQTFGQEAERIEALLRYAHLLPAHDLRPELRQARSRLRLLEAQARHAGRLASGPAAYARGRAHLALGEPETARPLLQQAWDGGLRTPEVALALGRVLAQEYRRALDRSRALPTRDLREARERELARDLRDPALEFLRRGAPAALESPAFHEALVAQIEGRWELAERKAREALDQTPWLYEAKRLEGEALLEQARAAQDPIRALACLERAEPVFEAALRLAPSDPATALGHMKAQVERLSWELASGHSGDASLDRCRALLAQVLALAPGEAEAKAQLARALGRWAELRPPQAPATQAAFQEAEALSSEALAQAPEHPTVLAIRITLLLSLGNKGAYGEDEKRMSWFQAALDLARAAQGRHPADPAFAALVAGACMRKMTWEIHMGRTPWASFEEGLAQAQALRARFPNLASAYHGLATLWVERAEYERTHGLDPRPSVAAALEAVSAAESRGLRLRNPAWTAGDAHLIRGQYLLATTGDGEADLLQAAENYRKAFRINPNLRVALNSVAEALLGVAEGRLERGGEVTGLLGQAEGALVDLGGRSPSPFETDHLKGRCHLLRGRLQMVSGGDPEADWRQAERAFQRAAERTEMIKALLGSAEVQARRFQRSGQPRARARTLALAQAVRARDPQRGEAWLWIGVVEQEAARRGNAEAQSRAREAWSRALALDANLQRQARMLGMP